MLNKNEIDDLLKLTQKLISYKSITPNHAGILDYIQQYLSPLGFKFIHLNKNQTTNLIASFNHHSNSKQVFAFAGHVDVVPAGDLTQWETDPFVLEEKNNYLYGRGISDMKGAIASFLIATKKYIESNPNNNASIMLLLTSDEEGSGIDGTPVIVDYLKKHSIRIPYCIVGEPTSKEVVGDVIKIGRRGSITGHIEIKGKQGHTAYPHLCLNPIHEFAPIMNELSNTTWDSGSEFFPPTSFQFTNIHSGLGVDNVIPGTLYAKFNLRYSNLHTANDLKNKITTIFSKYNVQYNIDWNHSAKPFLTKQNKLFSITKEAINKIMTIDTTPLTDGGTSDGRFLIEICDELLELGVSNRHIHQTSERIPKDDLIQLTNIYNLILNEIFPTK